jgi:DNA-binding MarR family transcriptional regulator
MVIEKQVRRGMVEQCDATLPQFDVLAALDRHPDGMLLGELSRSLLVSNGNVTALVQKLVRDGHVALTPLPADRRASVATLTEQGSVYFQRLAAAHNGWIEAMMAQLSDDQRTALFELLGAVKSSIGQADPALVP